MSASLAPPLTPAQREQELLRRLAQGPVSGDLLAKETGLTRAAIWKRIQALREAGIVISGSAGQGYTLEQSLDLLQDANSLRNMLPATIDSEIANLEVAWSLGSTNTELLQRPTPTQGCAVLLAERQTSGRGRRGRQWASPLAAHIYLSIARYFDGGLSRLGGLSLVAGIAAAQALQQLGVKGVGLKWPNDLVINDHKLGGLLIEGGGEAGGPARAVIGLGLNVHMPQAQGKTIDQPWIDLAHAMPHPPSRSIVVTTLLEHLIPALTRFDAQGLAAFHSAYTALDALNGRNVIVKMGNDNITGIAEGIADDGALRLRTDNGLRNFYAGEVSVRAS